MLNSKFGYAKNILYFGLLICNFPFSITAADFGKSEPAATPEIIEKIQKDFYAKIEPANKIDIEFRLVKFEFKNSNFHYEYKLYSKSTSLQNVFLIHLLNNTNEVRHGEAPDGWRESPPKNFLGWSSLDRSSNLKPGNSLSGFVATATGLPGIITFKAKGWVDPPKYPYGWAPPIPPDYDSRLDFLFGKAVAPVPIPEKYNHKDFINYLITLIVQMSEELHWIDRNKTDTVLWVTSLEQAWDRIHWWSSKKTAISIVEKFISDVDASKGQALDLEAWVVLKYNAEFLLQKLNDN